MNYTPKEVIDLKYSGIKLKELSRIIFKHDRGVSAISKFYNGKHDASYSLKENSDWQVFRKHFKMYFNINVVEPEKISYQVNKTIKSKDKEIAQLKKEIEELKKQIYFMENLPDAIKNVKRYAKGIITAINYYEKENK